MKSSSFFVDFVFLYQMVFACFLFFPFLLGFSPACLFCRTFSFAVLSISRQTQTETADCVSRFPNKRKTNPIFLLKSFRTKKQLPV